MSRGRLGFVFVWHPYGDVPHSARDMTESDCRRIGKGDHLVGHWVSVMEAMKAISVTFRHVPSISRYLLILSDSFSL